MSPLVYPFTRNSISSGASSSPLRLRWIKSTVRIMSNLAYHPKGLKVKKRLCHSGTKYPSSGVTTPDFRQIPLELTIVHPASGGWWNKGFRQGFEAGLGRPGEKKKAATQELESNPIYACQI